MPHRGNSNHVLLIEEDPKQTELYSELIREVADCNVDVMSRVESSFDWIGRQNYHLVVIDASSISEGVGGGLGLLEQIKRVSPVTSVIIVSDRATIRDSVAAIRLGAEDYLEKPFTLESFKLAVKRGLDRKAVFGENSGASSFLNLVNSCQMISASLDEKKILWVVRGFLLRELKSSHAAIYTLHPSDGGEPVRVDDAGLEDRRDRGMEEVIDIALQATQPFRGMVDAGELARVVERGQLTPGLFVFRFRCAGEVDYFCVCLSPDRGQLTEGFESRLKMLRAQLELTGKNIEQYRGVQQLVYVDDATGLYNTRYLHTLLEREITQAVTSQKSFAVLFIDADRFKDINDVHGHLVGTKLLHELGEELRRFVRRTDTVFRYGGDEFVAVLSPCDLPTAKSVAERIRESVEQRQFLQSEGKSIHFTVSIGVALFPLHADSKKAIIDAADQAMYAAKRASRNSVTIAQAAPEAVLEKPAPTAVTGLTAVPPGTEEAPKKGEGTHG